MHPFEVFPIVVWEELLERVEDCADRITVIRSHPALEALFENKIQDWLLAAVVPIMSKPLNAPEFPSLNRNFPPLRLVSKSICRAVDKSIESLWDNCADVPVNINTRRSFAFAFHPYFRYGFNVRRCLSEFGDYPPNRSPLVNPYSTVEVPFVNPRFPDMTEEERIQVFRKVGTHLRGLGLELQICRSVHSIERSRYLLEQILRLTPKLIYLWLPGDTFSYFNNEAIDVIQELQRTDKLNLPDLPFLRYIKVGHYMPPDEKDFLGLEKYFPQLTRLAIFWDHWKEEYYINSADLFPNLEYLNFCNIGNPYPPYFRSTNIRKLRNQLSNIYKIQAPKIKEFYFEVLHLRKEVVKTIVRAETRKGLAYLRKRFEGESNWECKVTKRGPDMLDIFLRRTTETGVNDGYFFGGDLGEDNLGFKRVAVKFASVTAILSAGVVLANRVNTPLVYCIPILLAAGLYNFS